MGLSQRHHSETLERMTEVHFSVQANVAETEPQITDSTMGDELRWSLDHIFSKNRVKRALQEFEPSSAAGPDGIRPIMLQKGQGSIDDAFICIVKASYRLGHTPEIWRNSASIILPLTWEG